ncbi:MAG: zf-HC2 domain-containing protein [Hyphomicrobiales bacterium]|nr:zf-HC2 domain-containing protein [Hyphomicrobiales bacterium]
MLTCKEVAERSSALIDGELGLWTKLQMRMHLAMCNGCRRFVSQMRLTDKLARAVATSNTNEVAQKDQIDIILLRLSKHRQQDQQVQLERTQK